MCSIYGLAQAQSLSGRIDENFSGLYKQSAVLGLVVGVYQGQLPGRADLRAVQVLLPPGTAARRVCFSAATFDGVYSASGELDAPAGVAGPQNIGVRGYSQYAGPVGRYAGDELAVGLVVSRDCNLLPAAVFVPATYGGPMDHVQVALNTKPTKALEVTLRSRTNERFLGECKAMETRKTAVFLQVCSFKIKPAAFAQGPGELNVRRKIGNLWRAEEPVSVHLYSGR